MQTTTQQPTGGGGKGGNRRQSTINIDYRCDLAAAVGQGRLRLLRLRFNEDTVYDFTGGGINPAPSIETYEAEDGALTGTAAIVSDSDFSGGQGVSGLSSGTLELDLDGGAADLYVITILYKSTSDVSCQILINGEAATYVFAASPSSVGFRSVVKSLPSASNTMLFQALSAVQGLRGRYHLGTDFETLALERVDPTINFDYGLSAPAPRIPADNFSIRWEGFVTPQFSETYTFEVEHDDGIRLYVNNLSTPLIDQWGSLGTHTATIALTAGAPVAIKLDYREGVNVAKIKLRWSSVSQPLQIIPQTALAPPIDANFKIDAVSVEPVIIVDPDERPNPTGIREEGFPAEEPQDNILLPDPKVEDTNPFERFNSMPVTDFDGVTEISLPNGCTLAWYEGSEVQQIDPVIAADLDAQYGAGSTPAFRGTSFFRLDNLTFTKYGTIPSMRVVVENIDTQTVEEICLTEALLASLEETDVDFSAGVDMHVRGIYLNGSESADKLFEQLEMIFNISFVESHDGVIKIKDLSDRTPVATIGKQDLGAFVAGESDSAVLDDVTSTVEDISEMIRTLELQFNNPKAPSDYKTDRVSHTFPYTPSVRTETRSLNATLLPEEAARINSRELQKHHLKQLAPVAFNLPYKFCWLDGGDCVEVEIDGEMKKVRIEQKTGSAPGVYEIAATSEEVFVLVDEETVESENKKVEKGVVFPANTVGTLIDIPALADQQEGRPGIYAACRRKGNLGRWEGAGLFREKGGAYGLLQTIDREAQIGRAVNALADIPAGLGEEESIFDPTNILIVDFYGDFAPTSVDSLQAEDGANTFVIGSEVCVVMNWTRDNDYPNRWEGSGIYRILKNTDKKATTHVSGERVVFLDDAVKFIPDRRNGGRCLPQLEIRHVRAIDRRRGIDRIRMAGR